MNASEPVRIGVIGLGFMGGTHIRALETLRREGLPVVLAAVCDKSGKLDGHVAARGNLSSGPDAARLFDPTRVAVFREPEALIASGVDLVHVCTPTPTHVALARAALQAGCHGLVEKPVAITSSEVEELLQVARAQDRICMPAMCMRFWPAWRWLCERIRAGSFGALRSLVLQRVGSRPEWSTKFYGDDALCGGALFDLHVHDADFLRACLGEPETVMTTGTATHLTTLYRFPDGPPHVVAEGGWSLAPGLGFRMRFLAAFEEATADFDLDRDPELVLARADGKDVVQVPPENGYVGEIRHLVRCLQNGSEPEVTLEDALAVTRLLEAERKSLAEGRPVAPE